MCIAKAVSRYTNSEGHNLWLEAAGATSQTFLAYLIEPEEDETLQLFIGGASSLLPEKVLFPLGARLTYPFQIYKLDADAGNKKTCKQDPRRGRNVLSFLGPTVVLGNKL